MDPKFLKRTIKKDSIDSHHLQTEKKVLVYLPPDFEETNLYPTLFLHDGDDYFSFGRIATQANQLISEQKIKALLMVAIPVEKEVRSAEYSPIGVRNEAHLQFMTRELFPYLAERYPIDQNQLVVGGSSLGGTVSLHLALRYPTIWNKVLSQSGAFLPQTITALENQPSLDWLTIYQSIGLQETAVPTHIGEVNLVTQNRKVEQKLRERNAKLRYVEQDGSHTWGLWQPELPNALIHFFGV
jgi:enterochelin esterase-like enzyme